MEICGALHIQKSGLHDSIPLSRGETLGVKVREMDASYSMGALPGELELDMIGGLYKRASYSMIY